MQHYEFTEDEAIAFNRSINNIQKRVEMLSELPQSPIIQNRRHRLIYLHDVLEIHNCRNNPAFQKKYLLGNRDWNTEFDIPVTVYINALTDIADEIMGEMTTASAPNISDRRKVWAVDQLGILFHLRMHRIESDRTHRKHKK